MSRCVSVRFLLIPEFVLCLLCTGRPNRQAKSRNYEAQTREKTIESGGVCFCCVVFVVFFVLCCSLNAVCYLAFSEYLFVFCQSILFCRVCFLSFSIVFIDVVS